jgi:hypothetical protein
MRLSATLAAAATLLAGGTTYVTTTAPAAATGPTETPVVAVVDSGINPFHQEFSYGGPGSTSDQLVGWWDFTPDKKGAQVLPTAGQTWDTAVADPYDDFGHGTMSAAMVGALGTSATETRAADPGAKLAIAKVLNSQGALGSNANITADAIRWAVDTVHADGVNISIGAVVPVPAVLYTPTFQAISYARSKGGLVTVANGNGFGGTLGPGDPGWASPYACSPDVLSVGGTEPDTYYQTVALALSTDPELVATYNVMYPSNTSSTGYVSGLGTSASAPWVAGFAAAVIGAARAAGTPLPVDRLETLLKDATTDVGLPPQFQGYGRLTLAELPAAKAHAAAGTLPTRPSPDVNGTYVDSGAGTLRTTWCQTLDVA